METVLIAGCGDVGTALGVRLAREGHRVIGLRRSAGALPEGLHSVSADLCDPAALAALPDGISVLCYTAAADGFDEQAYRNAYPVGLSNVLTALESAPLRRVLFVSSTGVYGQRDGEWVNERSTTEPTGFSGRILLEAESLLAELSVPASAVRFGGIYGPGRNRLIERVRAGAPCDDTLWTNRIHRDDCAGMLHHLLHVSRLDEVYIGVDCEPAPQCRVMDWIADQIGVARPERTEAGERRRGGSKRCSNRRALESGYRFIYPSFREGYAQVLGQPMETE